MKYLLIIMMFIACNVYGQNNALPTILPKLNDNSRFTIDKLIDSSKTMFYIGQHEFSRIAEIDHFIESDTMYLYGYDNDSNWVKVFKIALKKNSITNIISKHY